MRLLEAIIEANHQALAGDQSAGLHPKDFADALPMVALTCIDVRLNPLLPEVLGVPEEQFIWLRNAGNIITSPTSSTMRSLALACAVKGGKEIVIIGHSDCKVRQVSVADLTDRFRDLGVDRSRLPDNLNEFFGLFASERQNVLRGVDVIRQSPLIGPRIPVHGLMVDLETGKVDWLVNGYDALAIPQAVDPAAAAATPEHGRPETLNLPAFSLGEMKFPDLKIGEVAAMPEVAAQAKADPVKVRLSPGPSFREAGARFSHASLFRVVGKDERIYGPVSGADIEHWLADGRITAASLAQKVGYKEWKQLATFADGQPQADIPLPPPLRPGARFHKGS